MRCTRGNNPHNPPAETDAAGELRMTSDYGRMNARSLQTLPSAISTQRLARTTSKIADLIDHAHHHVSLATELCDGVCDLDTGTDDDWRHVTTKARMQGKIMNLMIAAKVRATKSVLVRALCRNSHVAARFPASSSTNDDMRYNRLEHSYGALTKHLHDTASSRTCLEEALTSFRAHAQAMESLLPPEPRDSRLMMTSLRACFGMSTDLVDELMSTLRGDIAPQTQSKLSQLAAFKVS